MADVSTLYVSDEPFEIEIDGVKLKVKEPTADDFVKCQSAAIKMRRVGNEFVPDFDMGAFNKKLIEVCVIEPKLDLKRLKGTVFRRLVDQLQERFGFLAEESFL